MEQLMRSILVVLTAAGALGLTACGHNVEQRAATGAATGLVLGGPVGAALGAGVGVVVSKAQDK
jgi:osmotically inducible lipoprotein OsmB